MPREDAGARCQLDWKLWPCWSAPGPASQLPTAGWGFRGSTAVLFSDTRGDPCLGFPGADGRLGPCQNSAVHHSQGVLPPLLGGSGGLSSVLSAPRSGLVAFTFPLVIFPCAAAWVTRQDAACPPDTGAGPPAQLKLSQQGSIPGGITAGTSVGMQD